ncbi:MAG: secretin N-terminal domain-containing protein [Verrucomicrobiota bacterium]
MKTIYTFFLALLFTPLANAQTDTNSPLPLPPRGRTVPARVTRSTNRSDVVIPAGTNAVVINTTTTSTTTVGTNAANAAVPIVKPSATNVVVTNTATTPPPAELPSAERTIPTQTTNSATLPAFPTFPVRKSPALTNSTTNDAATIEFNFQAMPLEQILEQYGKLVGRTLLRGVGLVPTLPITLRTESPLTRTEAITALETILAMNGVTFVAIGDKFAKVVLEAQAGTAGGKFSDTEPEDLQEAGKYVTQIIPLKFAAVQEVQAAVGLFAKSPASVIALPTSNTLIIRDYSENVKRIMEMIAKIDKVTELEVKPEVIPIKYALASDISQVLGSLTASGPGLSVGRSTRGAGVTGAGYQPGTTGTTGIGTPGQPNQFGITGQTGQSALGSAGTTGRNNFQRNLQNIVSRISSGADAFQVIGAAKIIADERTNSLLIFANDQDMIMIKTIIAQLDVVLAQVLIEAIIMEVSLDNGQQMGVSFLQQPKTTGRFTGAGGVNNGQTFPNSGTNGTGGGLPVSIGSLPGGLSYFGMFGSDFDVALTAVANDSRINVLSRPRIQTSHAVPATLFIGDTVPYITGTSFGNFNGGATSQYQEKRVGITLDVLPLINPDGLVVMDIQQNIQQLGTSVVIDGNQVPTTTERSAQAKVAVRDGETIILGGFISTSKSKSKSGVPYLKDIPGLGALFRTSSDTMRRVELIVLLRPKVLPSPEAAALVAATERDKLSGVKQGEFEIREMERKRQEQLDAEMRKKLGIKDRPL